MGQPVAAASKRGTKLEKVFEKIGLAKSSYEGGRKKYGPLTKKAL